MKTFGLMLGALALSSTAIAIAESEESGLYIGVGGGASDFDVRRDEVLVGMLAVQGDAVTSFPMTRLPPLLRSDAPLAVFATPFTNVSFDHTDSTRSLMLGYTFNRFFSAEVSYTDLGEVTSQQIAILPRASTDFRSMVIADQKVEIETISLTALATLPISRRFNAFVRVGYTFSQADSDLRIALLQEASSLSLDPSPAPPRVTAQSRTRDDSNSEGVLLGVGASFDVFKGFTLRADATSLMDVGGDAFTDKVDVEALSLTAIYRF